MNLLGYLLLVALSLAWGCGGGPATTTAPPAVSAEFQRLCRAVGAEGGKIGREQFLAQASDRETAARLFDACDVNHDNFITETEVRPERLESLQRQVIRLTSPKR
ncbi:MAG: hypothetical protein ACUVXF_00330 [Desulfobaccales bacterium]